MANTVIYPNLEPLLRCHVAKGLVKDIYPSWASVVARVYREAVTELQEQLDVSQETAAFLLCMASNLCTWPAEEDPCPVT